MLATLPLEVTEECRACKCAVVHEEQEVHPFPAWHDADGHRPNSGRTGAHAVAARAGHATSARIDSTTRNVVADAPAPVVGVTPSIAPGLREVNVTVVHRHWPLPKPGTREAGGGHNKLNDQEKQHEAAQRGNHNTDRPTDTYGDPSPLVRVDGQRHCSSRLTHTAPRDATLRPPTPRRGEPTSPAGDARASTITAPALRRRPWDRPPREAPKAQGPGSGFGPCPGERAGHGGRLSAPDTRANDYATTTRPLPEPGGALPSQPAPVGVRASGYRSVVVRRGHVTNSRRGVQDGPRDTCAGGHMAATTCTTKTLCRHQLAEEQPNSDCEWRNNGRGHPADSVDHGRRRVAGHP